ncbi:hypothetical protein CC85DRAFT_274160 [Cutaneotrichosporon oleaginosum]|uniref:RlpA-like protein double-psi beta-barrel domain-containing protein n=1 Tax=Cutaneotrichosporon oleaginosum TaxID=879819 RepID=A0A0J0XN24_9TREE|nr:uncharacterized protein CC85DRAFT_274160 [Cutaneotrichosporon oleaginosum]KLT42492.1 hypothetical protein CC85DRAFT_274160 [Cutaneotrichosporon oleaginosum]TXT07765.1 hypothetical protein COLE_04689 [Cutaneotrichosporon oleaginosum]
MLALLVLLVSLFALVAAAPIPHAKRFEGKATYYVAGLGACGNYNTGADMIVALNQAQWDGGAHCGKSITITEGGKTAQATIVDLCPGCPYGALDLSESLFSVFHDHGKGVFQLSWNFNDGSGGGGGGNGGQQQQQPSETPAPAPNSPSPQPQPQPTPTPTPTPSPEAQTPSSSQSTPSSSSISSGSSSSSAPVSSSSVLSLSNSTITSSTLSSNSTWSTSSLPASASATNDAILADSPSPDGALADLGELVASLGRIVVVGATA